MVGAPQVRTIRIYRRMGSVTASKPAQQGNPLSLGGHSDSLHSTPARPRSVPGCVRRHPGGPHHLTLSILRPRRYPMPRGTTAERLRWSPAAS